MRSVVSALFFAAAVSALAEPYVTVEPCDYMTGTSTSEWAQYTLDTSGNVTVKNGANVSFGAGSRVTLRPGFKVEAGATFKSSVAYNPTYNPGGYYNTVMSTLTLIAGNQQYGQVGQFNSQPFDIAIWNQAGTAPLVNAPVLITVNSGGGWLSLTNDSNAVLSKTLKLTTDSDGTVHVYFQHGTTELVTSSIQVVAGSQTWEFTTFSYSTTGANADTDGDGISNTAEALLGMNSTQPAIQSTIPELTVFTP